MSERLRPLFFLAAIAGASYYVVDHRLAAGALHTVWKGAGVGLLALWAAGVARDRDGWLLAAVMALGAAGDVLLEVAGLRVGAVAFLGGHLVAIVLYLRHRRAVRAQGRAVALALLVATPLVSWLLSHDVGVALYASGLGAMAACAWMSRFPRGLVGLGVMLFVLSDWLIFARAGVLAGSVVPDLVIWPAYFGGQALIAWGVATALHEETRA